MNAGCIAAVTLGCAAVAGDLWRRTIPNWLTCGGVAAGVLCGIATSGVRGAAQGRFREIKTDIDGQPRKGRLDVGCDQISQAPILNRPLTAADVGPLWSLE